MKVVFLVPSLGMGGMERVLVNYANLFLRRGYDVTVYNFTYDDQAMVSGFDDGVKYIKNYAPVKNLFHTPLKQIFKGNFRILPWNIWLKFHSAKYLYKQYIKDDFDVEIAFFGMAALKIISGSTNEKAKKIGWLHSVNLEDDIRSFGGEKKVSKIYNDIETLFCVSKTAKEKVSKFFNRTENLYTVNNPNDTQRIRALALEPIDVEKKKFTFTVVARIVEYHKAFFRLLRVCKRLESEALDFDLWIVGDGADYNAVKDYAEELGVKSVSFFGQKSNPYPYIKNADMYLCASNFEGFSMVMMEAIIIGTPILSTRVSGADEMLDDGKYGIIVENSEEGLYNGMKNLLLKKDTFVYFKDMAQLRKDYLSENEIMDKVEAIIKGQIEDD